MRNTDNHARNTAIQRFENGEVQLSPVFDFAPMFMDPEVIARSIHWRNADGTRLKTWAEVLASLDVGIAERANLVEELGEFAETVANIPRLSKDAGVDAHVLAACEKHIYNQAQQLGGLVPHDVIAHEPERKTPRG